VQCENQVDFDVEPYKNSDVKIHNFLGANGFKLPYKLANKVKTCLTSKFAWAWLHPNPSGTFTCFD
jgi:hypothetical protein